MHTQLLMVFSILNIFFFALYLKNDEPKTPVETANRNEGDASCNLPLKSLILKEGNSNPATAAAAASVDVTASSSSSSSSSAASASTASFVRRSGRTRVNRDDFVLRVDSSSKLQDIRLQMMRLIGAAPFDQHLALDVSFCSIFCSRVSCHTFRLFFNILW